MSTKSLTLCIAALGILAASLPAQTVQPDAPFGQIGIAASETARINAYCRADVPPGPCVVAFAFYDTQGRILKQVSLTLMPGRAGSLDIQGTEINRSAMRAQLVPGIRMGSGAVLDALEVFDTQTGATRALLGAIAVTAQ